MSNETRSFNEPVIYTSSIVYATESRSFLPTLREAYRRFKRARSIINLSWESLSTSRVWSKAQAARRGRLPSKSSECSCSRGSWKARVAIQNHFRIPRHCQGWTKPCSMDLIVDPRAPLLLLSSPTFLQNWFSLTNPVEGTVRSLCAAIPLERHGKLEKGTLRFLIGSNCELTFRGWPGKKIYYGLVWTKETKKLGGISVRTLLAKVV